MAERIDLVHPHGPNATDLSESRGKGMQMVSPEPAHGVTIVPDDAPAPVDHPGPVVTASDAADGPADFDG
jgi:hypothetical protein